MSENVHLLYKVLNGMVREEGTVCISGKGQELGVLG